MRADDPRWVILVEDGSYATVSRHREPDDADILTAEQALARAGKSGWLAVLSQSVHSAGVPEMVMARPLRGPGGTFEDARAKFLARVRPEGGPQPG